MDDHLALLLLLDVVKRDPGVGGERGHEEEWHDHPHHLEARVAVDGCSVPHVARAGAEADHAVDRHRHHEDEDRDGDDQEDVVERVDLVRLRARRGGEPVDGERDRDADDRRDEADGQHPSERVLVAVGAHGARSYWTRWADCRALRRVCSARGPGSLWAAEARRRRSVVAPERLGELGGLPVADAVGHVAHGHVPLAEQLEGAPHPHFRHVRAEARLAHLGERPLELAPRGGEPPRDVVQLDRVGVLALDDLGRLLEQSAPAGLRAGSDRHEPDTGKSGLGMNGRSAPIRSAAAGRVARVATLWLGFLFEAIVTYLEDGWKSRRG